MTIPYSPRGSNRDDNESKFAFFLANTIPILYSLGKRVILIFRSHYLKSTFDKVIVATYHRTYSGIGQNTVKTL